MRRETKCRQPARRYVGSALGLLILFCAAACRRAPVSAPLRPTLSGPSQFLIDAEGVRHEGTLVSGVFPWVLAPQARGHLRFSWASRGPRGKVSVLAELVPRGNGAHRLIGRATRMIPEGSDTAVFFDEDWILPSHEKDFWLQIRLEPAGSFFLTDARIVTPDRRAGAVWLLLFDTTRRDAIGLYGCPDPSTPNLDAILRGAWKAERAYAAASWTIPSAASLLTGRVPEVEEDPEGGPRGVIAGMATMAMDFRKAGWSTAAFVANPTIHAGNGFAEGFTAFFTTPYDASSMTLPADVTIRRVPRWLAAHKGEPFFLWIFLLDPHDPYTPPDRPRGFTPFDADYRGAFRGDEIEKLQLGLLPRPSGRDIRHLRALYHDEVRYADSRFGGIWNGLDSDERARATLVFSADHGEEFAEHGGWKHGPALVDEVLRVPLLIRSGAAANARRMPPASAAGLVSLLDVLPTVESLVGLAAPRRPLDGRNLSDPAASQRDRLPVITMLTGGGARAAVVRPDSKLVFYDRLGIRGMPDAAKDRNAYGLAERLRSVLPALGRFDLKNDPGETKILPIDDKTFASDWRAVEEAIALTRPGLQLRFLGGAGASPLRFVVEGFAPAAAAQAFALDDDDRYTWTTSPSGGVLSGTLDVAADVDGFLVTGPPSDLKVTVESATCVDLTVGSQRRELVSGRAEAIPQASIPAGLPRFDRRGRCSGVFVWRSAGTVPTEQKETEERIKKLRALGYLH